MSIRGYFVLIFNKKFVVTYVPTKADPNILGYDLVKQFRYLHENYTISKFNQILDKLVVLSGPALPAPTTEQIAELKSYATGGCPRKKITTWSILLKKCTGSVTNMIKSGYIYAQFECKGRHKFENFLNNNDDSEYIYELDFDANEFRCNDEIICRLWEISRTHINNFIEKYSVVTTLSESDTESEFGSESESESDDTFQYKIKKRTLENISKNIDPNSKEPIVKSYDNFMNKNIPILRKKNPKLSFKKVISLAAKEWTKEGYSESGSDTESDTGSDTESESTSEEKSKPFAHPGYLHVDIYNDDTEIINSLIYYIHACTSFSHVIYNGKPYYERTNNFNLDRRMKKSDRPAYDPDVMCDLHCFEKRQVECDGKPTIYPTESDTIEYVIKYDNKSFDKKELAAYFEDSENPPNANFIVEMLKFDPKKVILEGYETLHMKHHPSTLDYYKAIGFKTGPHGTKVLKLDHRGSNHCKVYLDHIMEKSADGPITLHDLVTAFYEFKVNKWDKGYETMNSPFIEKGNGNMTLLVCQQYGS